MSSYVETNLRPEYDSVIQAIARYVLSDFKPSQLALDTAAWCLIDSLGCATLARNFKECTKLLGPIVPGGELKNGARVLGLNCELDPVCAAFNIGVMIRWLDFNDTWLAAEWGHPSDNLGAILAVSDYVCRNKPFGTSVLTMHDLLLALIQAHEIQGCFALQNSFNQVGLDHVILVKLASAAVSAKLMGADFETLCAVISQVFVDGQSLRTYRHAPNTGSRKSWAAGDATARGVFLALMSLRGETGYPGALTTPKWGFYDVLFGGKSFQFERPYGCYVMENILFKIAYPAEFHAQTAVECAISLHPKVKANLDDILKIEIRTHASAIRIISKEGELHNPADRDHCLQYMVAIALLFGELRAEHYEDNVAKDPRIDVLRSKMQISENLDFSRDYHLADKRSIANQISITFKDGTYIPWVTVEYPIGHPRRRAEGIPILIEKFKHNLGGFYDDNFATSILDLVADKQAFYSMPADEFISQWG